MKALYKVLCMLGGVHQDGNPKTLIPVNHVARFLVFDLLQAKSYKRKGLHLAVDDEMVCT